MEHDKKSGRDSIERDVEVSGSLGGMEEAGDVEDTEEGWDDELEAAELALFQESLSVSDMEWVEDEETEHSRLSVGSKAIERERESNFEHGEKLRKKLKERQEHSLSKTPCSDATVSHNQHKYSFIKPRYPSGQPTSKAVRSVVKKGGDLAQLTSVTDSPLPGTIPPKKSSGQSIYKAPGHREPLQTGYVLHHNDSKSTVYGPFFLQIFQDCQKSEIPLLIKSKTARKTIITHTKTSKMSFNLCVCVCVSFNYQWSVAWHIYHPIHCQTLAC